MSKYKSCFHSIKPMNTDKDNSHSMQIWYIVKPHLYPVKLPVSSPTEPPPSNFPNGWGSSNGFVGPTGGQTAHPYLTYVPWKLPNHTQPVGHCSTHIRTSSLGDIPETLSHGDHWSPVNVPTSSFHCDKGGPSGIPLRACGNTGI